MGGRAATVVVLVMVGSAVVVWKRDRTQKMEAVDNRTSEEGSRGK